jgi:hypothetical protein
LLFVCSLIKVKIFFSKIRFFEEVFTVNLFTQQNIQIKVTNKMRNLFIFYRNMLKNYTSLTFSFTSIFPEAFSTAFMAPAEALSTIILNLDFNSPFANNFTHKVLFQITFFSSKTSLFISTIPAFANNSKSLNVIILYSFLKTALEKPLSLGVLLNKGVCPHSNQAGIFPQLLAFCHLQPLHEKVPFPEPFHLQSLLLVFLAQLYAFMLFKFKVIFTY